MYGTVYHTTTATLIAEFCVKIYFTTRVPYIRSQNLVLRKIQQYLSCKSSSCIYIRLPHTWCWRALGWWWGRWNRWLTRWVGGGARGPCPGAAAPSPPPSQSARSPPPPPPPPHRSWNTEIHVSNSVADPNFFHLGSVFFTFPDPHQKNLTILTQKNDF